MASAICSLLASTSSCHTGVLLNPSKGQKFWPSSKASRTFSSLLVSASPLFSSLTCWNPLRAGKSVHIQNHGKKCFILSVCALKKLSELEPVELSTGSTSFPAAPGIYAVYDKEGKLQYVGLSRRVSLSLQNHVKDLPALCVSAKFEVIEAPEKAALTDAWKAWMEEHIHESGDVPPGNISGNTTWTARKQRQTKPEIRLTPGAHVKLNVSLEELIDKVVKECKVVAFIKGTRTSPQCGFSHRVLTILNEQGVDYETLNVLDEDHNPGLREAIKNYSQWPTIPQVYVKGEFVGGADVLDEMVQSGEVVELFKKLV